jgi:adenylate kinase
MKLIFLGAPGAGKGTQSEVVCKHLCIPAISTGNIIREAMKTGTLAGLSAKKYVEAGQLVPDETVIEMLRDRISQGACENGYILDGFPRNVAQAKELERMGIVIDKVIEIQVGEETIVERLSGRRVCEDCGASYHIIYKPSLKGERCESCNGRLTIRGDDTPEMFKGRLKVYKEQTAPLKDYYSSKGKLRVVTGATEIEETTRRTLAALEAP